ncbi:polymer-forming cytoskeletal protein [Bacteroidota bacterium]
MIKNNLPESQTINQIGSGTTIKGDIKSNGDFRIDGSLNGSIESKGKIVVGESGKVEGQINCQNAVISGTVKANIRVSDLLELKSSSKFEGEIITKKLSIEPGAKFSGSCNMEDVTSNINAGGKYGSAKEKAS